MSHLSMRQLPKILHRELARLISTLMSLPLHLIMFPFACKFEANCCPNVPGESDGKQQRWRSQPQHGWSRAYSSSATSFRDGKLPSNGVGAVPDDGQARAQRRPRCSHVGEAEH